MSRSSLWIGAMSAALLVFVIDAAHLVEEPLRRKIQRRENEVAVSEW